MSDFDDEDETPTPRRRPGEGVRIIGAEEAAAALEEGKVSGRRPEDQPRFGDVPPKPTPPASGYRFPLPESVDPAEAVPRPPVVAPGATSPPEMPHWTEPPTGEVPRVLGGQEPPEGDDLGAWSGLTSRAPRWRSSGADWDDADFDDVSALADEETRIGALDDSRSERSDLYSFDEPGPEPEEAAVPAAPTRIRTRTGPPPDNGYPRPPGASGRDLTTAIGVGVAIGVVALVCFKLGPPATLALATVAVTAAAAEAYAVVRKAGYRPATLLGLAGTVSLMLAVYEKGPPAYPLVLSLFMIFSFLWYLVRVEAARPTVNVAVTALAFLWTAGLGSFAALSLTLPNRQGIALILLAVVGTVAYDVGGLFFGSQMGSRPLLPEISPNKTWEGLIGGCMSAVVFCAIVGGLVKPWSLSRGIVLGLVVAVAAPLGDLCQSMIKRDIGIKDMGSILPGHGGVLDRVDALLFVLPAAYYLGLLLHFNNVIR